MRFKSLYSRNIQSSLFQIACIGLLHLSACVWDPGRLFDRPDPAVERARKALELSQQGADADLNQARQDLEEVLRFHCRATDAGYDLVLERPNASLDLGLVVFRISELFGHRFGEEEQMAEASNARENEGLQQIMASRAREFECAQLLLGKIANEPTASRSLALRSRYLLGNFAFLSRRYQLAVEHYDKVLLEHPARGNEPIGEVGPPNDDDAVARNAAWNRAIALKRIEDQKPDSGNDSSPDANSPPDSNSNDAHNDGASDSNDSSSDANNNGNDGASDSNQDGGGNGGNDSGSSGDSGRSDQKPDSGNGNPDEKDASSPPPPSPSTSASAPPPPPASSSKVDLRELDRFDQKAPLELDPSVRRRRIPKSMDK